MPLIKFYEGPEKGEEQFCEFELSEVPRVHEYINFDLVARGGIHRYRVLRVEYEIGDVLVQANMGKEQTYELRIVHCQIEQV